MGKKLFLSFVFLFISTNFFIFSHLAQPPKGQEEQALLSGLHSISSHKLLDYVKELTSEKYGGRLTGTEEYNASGVAVMLGVAEALANCPIRPRRSVVFLFFGAEEQGVAGSEYYVEHPVFPLEKTVALLNLEGVGCGDKIDILAGKNFPEPFFWRSGREVLLPHHQG